MVERDELGVKPLYYWAKNPTVAANSIRELFDKGVPRRLSIAGVRSYLEYGCVCEPWTIVEDVLALPPGCELRSDGSVVRYWHPCSIGSTGLGGGKEFTPECVQVVVTEALETAVVRAMGMVDGGQPITTAAFLSGGIDSSAIVALMRRLYDGEIRTYCVTHEDPRTDECEWARKVAEKNGTRHVELMLTGDMIGRYMMDAVACYDQPSLDGINFWFVSKLVSEAGEKSVLSGEGGDELFVGYDRFDKPRTLRAFERKLAKSGIGKLKFLGHLIERFASNEKMRKLGMLMATRHDPYFISRRVLSDAQIDSLLKPELRVASQSVEPFAETWDRTFGGEPLLGDQINNLSWHELTTVLLSMYLHDGWQVSRPFGLDIRTPLLEPELVKLMFSIPGYLKCSPECLKPLLVCAAGEGIPRECVDRKKQGFTLPFDRYFGKELKGELESFFMGGQSMFFDGTALRTMWNDYHSGRVNWSRIWTLYMLENWCVRNGMII